MSEQNQNSNNIVSEPSTFSAIKDQLVGATKEVIGAVFNEDLQNAGAQQRIHGEKQFEALKSQTSSSSEAAVTAPSEASRGWFGITAPSIPPAQPSEASKGWFGYSDPEKTLMESSQPPSSWFGSSEPVKATPVGEPSTLTALKDQVVGSTKEVVGAVFNQNLQNSGATQRIEGEKALRELQGERDSNWPLQSGGSQAVPESSEPSRLLAVKDQLVGSTKEVLGAVFSQNLQTAGVEQRIHGEREYETAVMAQETQGKWDQVVGTAKETTGHAFDNKKLEAAGLIQRKEGDIERLVNA